MTLDLLQKIIKEYNIPSYVTKLDDSCFRECQFTKITIPPTIKKLPKSCFRIVHMWMLKTE